MGHKKVVFTLSEGWHRDADLLGGKGFGLAKMASLGVPVPPALTVATTVSRGYQQFGKLPKRFSNQLALGLKRLEKQTGKKLGSTKNPLLVSVRSGAKQSMPGMMDTILNLGMNPSVTRVLAMQSGEDFAWDSYRRFLTMFSSVVFNVKIPDFASTDKKEQCEFIRKWFAEKVQMPFPDDPMVQLSLAILAVIKSWNSERAQLYRSQHNIPEWLGTAVNIQAMVFGNLGEDSGTGVVFSRDVSTGSRGLYGEFLPNAQGEDIVSGTRTPLPISAMKEWNPVIYQQLEETVQKLEKYWGDVVDVEFTVEKGVLYILQVRVAKRTPEAALTFATQFVWEKKWTKEEAILRSRRVAREIQQSVFKEEEMNERGHLTQGLPASPGIAVGMAVYSSAKAVRWANAGHKVILIRPDTSPNDLSGMIAASAIVTATGGTTSHAAVVARGLNKPAIVGASSLVMREDEASIGGRSIYEGDTLSIDGRSGKIYYGSLTQVPGLQSMKKEISLFFKWMMSMAPPVPEPYIDFRFAEQRHSENKLLNDFYLVDALAMELEGTALEKEAAHLRAEIHHRTAEHLACYLTLAVAGELRHMWVRVSSEPCEEDEEDPPEACKCPVCKARRAEENGFESSKETDPVKIARNTLAKRYGITSRKDRGETQRHVIQHLQNASTEELIEFFELSVKIFAEMNWHGGYGGKNWADIARAPLSFLKKEITHSVFADHVFDLQHNNGTVFGKHPMFNGGRENIHRQLGIKKMTSGAKRLYEKLRGYSPFSPAVDDLYVKGIMLLEKRAKKGEDYVMAQA